MELNRTDFVLENILADSQWTVRILDLCQMNLKSRKIYELAISGLFQIILSIQN